MAESVPFHHAPPAAAGSQRIQADELTPAAENRFENRINNLISDRTAVFCRVQDPLPRFQKKEFHPPLKMTTPRTKGFTLIELLVVIGIIALLASIAVPAFTGVQIRAAQTKAMSNAKQIGLACKQYAIDNNGSFPIMSGSATTSNDCFDELLPAYLTTISLFWQAKDHVLVNQQPGDPNFATQGAPYLGQRNYNHWAYVPGLFDTSNSASPLIADGFATLSSHSYTYDDTAQGGVWKGQQAIIIHTDDSAAVLKCTQTSTGVYQVLVSGTDVFSTTGPFLSGTANTVVNPYGYN
jgi:prepilin-type N-terminal cleavage/methylation domain-containing protein